MNWERKRQRKQDVIARAAYRDSMYSYCRIIGCGELTTAATNSGLNRIYCRAHEDHYERHGSHVKRSYTAGELRPHRKAAKSWLQKHRRDREVQLATRAVEGLYRRAGPLVEAFRLRGRTPGERANAVWARLREDEVDSSVPLAVWLSVEAVIKADPVPERHVEFKRVQAAKLIHRMAGGSHRQWERTADGRRVVEAMHVYPASRGRVLRHIGQQLERAAELLSR